jgi:hypothetical protein
MPSSWFRKKSEECGRQALDAARTDAERAEYKHQQRLWLKIADDADDNDDARRLRLALRDAP